MDYVTPKQILSPYSGRMIKPKIIEREYYDKIVVEAQWWDVEAGIMLKKGIVKEVPKSAPGHPEK